ncbi:MAG: hypothetical protein AAF802_27625, partial [Planctomycetota bacterium]
FGHEARIDTDRKSAVPGIEFPPHQLAKPHPSKAIVTLNQYMYQFGTVVDDHLFGITAAITGPPRKILPP